MADHLEHIKLEEFFDINDKKNAEIFRNAGICNYSVSETMKSMFVLYLLGKKNKNLAELLVKDKSENPTILNDPDDSVFGSLSAAEKKALGEEFLNDIRKRPIYGEVNGGEEKVKENLKWYGEMFSGAMDRISYESNFLADNNGDVNSFFMTLDDFSTEESVCQFKDHPFMALGTVASNFILETSVNYTRRSNRPTNNNNYGIDMGKAFLEGYGGYDKFKKDTNRIKTVSIIAGYADKVQEAVEKNDKVEAVAAFTAGQVACKFHEDVIDSNSEAGTEEEYNDIRSADVDENLSSLMEEAAATTYINFKQLFVMPEPKNNEADKAVAENKKKVEKPEDKALRYMPLLKGEDLGKKESKFYEKVVNSSVAVSKNNVYESNIYVARNIIETINMNNNSEIYDAISENRKYSLGVQVINDIYGDKTENTVKLYDDIFASLIDSEKSLMTKMDKKDLFDNFKIDGKSVREYLDWSFKEAKVNKKNYTEEMLGQYCKHLVICAMGRKDVKLTYTPYKLSDADDKDVELSGCEIEIKRPAAIKKLPYSEIKDFRRDIEGIAEAFQELKLIDSIFHVNRKLFKNVKTSLGELMTICENLYEKNEFGEHYITKDKWKEVQKKLENVTDTLNAYIKKREGASSKLGKKRLSKIKSIKGNISAIRHRTYAYAKDVVPMESNEANMRAELYDNDIVDANVKDEAVNYDWNNIRPELKVEEYVFEEEYNGLMKDLYITKENEKKLVKPVSNNVNNDKKHVNKKVISKDDIRKKMLDKIKKGNNIIIDQSNNKGINKK